MERRIKDKNLLNDFAERFCRVVEKHSRYIIVSGFVAISSGRVRGTEDIDMIIEKLDAPGFLALHNALTKAGFKCMQTDDADEIFEYLAENASVRYTFGDSPLPEMELKFAKDELDEYQLRTRTKLPLTGLDIWFSSINMNIAFKEELLRSDKDIEDAEHLRKVYSELIDGQEIEKIKSLIRKTRL
jgi:hypothetical protein